jgi:hypothetical protein
MPNYDDVKHQEENHDAFALDIIEPDRGAAARRLWRWGSAERRR